MENLQIVPVENEREKSKRMSNEQEERDSNFEIGAQWLLTMLNKSHQYGERIPLKKDRSFDIPQDVTELPLDVAQLVRTAYRMEFSSGRNQAASVRNRCY